MQAIVGSEYGIRGGIALSPIIGTRNAWETMAAGGTSNVYTCPRQGIYLVAMEGTTNEAWRGVWLVIYGTHDPVVQALGTPQYLNCTLSGADIVITNTHDTTGMALQGTIRELAAQ
jgi:hypothetical protein